MRLDRAGTQGWVQPPSTVNAWPVTNGGSIRGEKQHGADEILRHLRRAECIAGDDALLLLGRDGLALDLGEGRARQNRIDGNAVAPSSRAIDPVMPASAAFDAM